MFNFYNLKYDNGILFYQSNLEVCNSLIGASAVNDI
jgi:hypothetical protein